MEICVPIQARTQNQAKKAMSEVNGKADMAELWLDQIKDLDIGDLLKGKLVPVICVCKRPNERGPKDSGLLRSKFKGSWSDVADILIEASKNGAEYIDLPLNMPKNLSKKCVQESNVKGSASGGSKVIMSYHDFRKTPSLKFMLKKAEEMKNRGADIVKISVMAKTLADTLQIIFLAKELHDKKIPHILIAMGRVGILSRVLTPTLGGEIMFAPLSKGKKSAPGQLTVDELRSVWSNLQ